MAEEQKRERPPPFSNTAYDVVAIGASAGGLAALSEVLSHLPADFPAAIVIVQHLAPERPSRLAQILGKRTPLKVQEAEEGNRLAAGCVYIAPPDRHLLVNADGTLSLTDTERVHFSRPSADRLFESVATSFGERTIAVVLTGADHDGADGVRAIKSSHGKVLAQDEATSEYFGMPQAAAETGDVDLILPLDEVAPALVELVKKD